MKNIVELGVKKIAFIESPEIFAQMSIEQTMQEDEGKKIQVKHFKNEDNAIKWLL